MGRRNLFGHHMPRCMGGAISRWHSAVMGLWCESLGEGGPGRVVPPFDTRKNHPVSKPARLGFAQGPHALLGRVDNPVHGLVRDARGFLMTVSKIVSWS